MGKWVTISRYNGQISSTDAHNLYEAGVNHLATALKIKATINGEQNET